MFHKTKIINLVILLSIFSLFFIGAALKIDRGVKDNTYKELSLLADTISIVQSQYVDESKPKDLIYGALKGMLSSLDPYSEFLSPQEYKELKADTEGRFGGVGMEITLKDGLITVVSPLEDTPAWNAGIKAGDKIVKINEVIIKDYTLTDAVRLLRGEPGTEVKVTIWRQNDKKMLDFKLTRAVIKVEEIKDVRIVDKSGIGYIRLVEFSEETYNDLSVALEELSKQNMKGLVLDVRYNPGGLLDVAAKVAEMFLDKNMIIVSTKGRENMQNLEFRSRTASKYKDLPMVVLINEGSASGSEILAGALKDHRRAIIIGEKTFGKGSVQTVIPLSDGSALKLTTSKYFTPSGVSIHGEGIKPDIEIKYEQVGSEEKEDVIPEEIVETFEAEKKSDDPFEKRYKTDNQLIRAVDILKGVLIYNKKIEG
jgi:carboxyl-terminal processing protease